MNEWEAKYKALAAGVNDPKLIENAERIVKDAIEISNKSGVSLEWALESILRKVAERTFDRPTFLGIPVSPQGWVPEHCVALVGPENIIITDLRTGKVKNLTKEDMGRIFGEEEKSGGHPFNCQCSGCKSKKTEDFTAK